MDNRLLSLYLSRILSGEYIFIHNSIKYKLVYPDVSIKYEAELFAQEQYDKNKFNDWISTDSILNFLVDIGIWSYDRDQKIEQLEKQIENYKVDLYNNFLNPKKIKSIKKSLESTKKNYNKLYDIRHSLDSVTLEGFIESLKNQHTIIHSLYDKNNELVFKDAEDIDYILLQDILLYIGQNTIDIKTFRQIARSELWRNYWSANNSNIFNKSTINWTDEQKTLVVLTKMYDSAHEHPECPPDSVLEDDDMFDGWMIIQKRQHEKTKADNRNEKMLKDKNLGNAKEVFLVANSKEEVNNIYNLNDPNSRNIIKERNQVLSQAKENVPESKLPDVQRDLVIQQNQQFMQSRKK